MRIMRPVEVNSRTLKYSSIPENDDGYPEWERGYVFNEHTIVLTDSEIYCYYKNGSTHTYQNVIDTSMFSEIRGVWLNPSQTILLVYGNISGAWAVYRYNRNKTSSGVSYSYIGLENIVPVSDDIVYVNLAWSPDGRFLAVGVENKFYVYHFKNNTFIMMAVSGAVLDMDSYHMDVSFSKESKYVAAQGFVGGTAAGRLFRVYEVVNTSLVREVTISPTITMLRNGGYVEFSPTDNFLIRVLEISLADPVTRAQVLSYDSSGSFTEEADAMGIGGSRNGLVLKPSFSYDGVYVAIACRHEVDWSPDYGSETERVYFFQYDGESFSVIDDPTTTPASKVNNVKFSKTDYHVYVGVDSSPYMYIYALDEAGEFNLISNPASLPGSYVVKIETANISGWGYGSICKYGDTLYESIRANNFAGPGDDDEIKSWIEVSPINRMRMFDQYANTFTSDNEKIVVQIESEGITHIGLLGVVGASEVTVRRLNSSDEEQWSDTIATSNTERIIIDLDQSLGGGGEYVEITIGDESDDNVSVGRCVPALAAITYPNLQYGLEYSPVSWGKMLENDYGNIYLQPGNYADEFDCKIIIQKDSYDALCRMLRSYRETNILWDLNGVDTGLEYLITYGFYIGRPRIVLQYPNDYGVSVRIREFT